MRIALAVLVPIVFALVYFSWSNSADVKAALPPMNLPPAADLEHGELSRKPDHEQGFPVAVPSQRLSASSQLKHPSIGVVGSDSYSNFSAPENARVINIGEPFEPNDPSTWPQAKDAEVISIGAPLTADELSTWGSEVSSEVIKIGDPIDPNDTISWPQSESNQVINIGMPLDPDYPLTSPADDSAEVINIGDPIDPDAPSI